MLQALVQTEYRPFTNTVICTFKCPACEQHFDVEVKAEDLEKYTSDRNALCQDCFPYIDGEQRELFISGICATCWEKLFGGVEE